MAMLDQAADWFKGRKTSIRSWYEDDQGRYAFAVVVDGQSFVVVAKKYLNDGQASFMSKKVVQRAIDTDALVLLFVGSGKRLVFDPDTVMEAGQHGATHEDQRKARGEDWVDVDADLGVSFRRWYDGDAEPTRLGDIIDESDDRPDRPCDVTAWSKSGGRDD